jgi:hypothetical protein
MAELSERSSASAEVKKARPSISKAASFLKLDPTSKLRKIAGTADKDVDLANLKEAITTARTKNEGEEEGSAALVPMADIETAETRLSELTEKRATAASKLLEAFSPLKASTLNATAEDAAASLRSALEAAQETGVAQSSYALEDSSSGRALVLSVEKFFGIEKKSAGKLMKEFSSGAGSKMGAMLGMSTPAKLRAQMKNADDKLDVSALEGLCEKARTERKAEEEKPNNKLLESKCLPYDEIEAAEARAAQVAENRHEKAVALAPYTGSDPLPMSQIDTTALSAAVEQAKGAGVAQKTHMLRDGGGAGKELVKACEGRLKETSKARDEVTKLLKADADALPEKLNTTNLKEKGLDRVEGVGGIDAELVAKAREKLEKVLADRRKATEELVAANVDMAQQDTDLLKSAIDAAKFCGVGEKAYVLGDGQKGAELIKQSEKWLKDVLQARKAATKVLEQAVTTDMAKLNVAKLKKLGIKQAKLVGGIPDELVQQLNDKVVETLAARTAAESTLIELWERVQFTQHSELTDEQKAEVTAALEAAKSSGMNHAKHKLADATNGKDFYKKIGACAPPSPSPRARVRRSLHPLPNRRPSLA